ncbi:MAG: hypothetical protein KDC54_07230, partial [Lewinella sp.]|nr:hypothetical protein [Lewinella sp.]
MKHLSTLGVLLALGLLLFLRFPDFFQYGNSRVIEPWGDGYKTYHAYLYHIRHDSTLSHFAGMNYPYGEHVVPGDCEPVLSNGVKLLQRIGWSSAPDYALGMLHFSLLFGVLLSGLFLFLTFRRLELPVWYAALVAIGLTFLAPQVLRLISHYGLARLEVLPILFYLLLRYEQQPHWRWGLWMGVVVWIYAGIHFYFFAIAAFLIFGYFALRWLLRRDWPRTLTYLAHGSLALLLPLLFYYWWMIYSDPVTDRNPVPWGFYAYRAHWEGLFTHLGIPHWRWFNEAGVKIRTLDPEAQNYIGTVAAVFIVVALLRWRRPAWLR